jgi:hypothetical protein
VYLLTVAPPLPALKLPLPPRRLGPGAIVAIVIHVLFLAAILYERSSYMNRTLGDPGPKGGGGSGDPTVRYFSVPRAAAPAAATVPVTPPVPVPEPEVKPLEIARIQITPQHVPLVAPVLSGTGTGSAGSGGGAGGGSGTGVGTHTGPGSGGDGGYIVPPEVIGLVIPPDCASGQFAVSFSIDTQGRVDRVELDPLPKDGGCRREFLARLREYKFKPARTAEGRPVAGVVRIDVTAQ